MQQRCWERSRVALGESHRQTRKGREVLGMALEGLNLLSWVGQQALGEHHLATLGHGGRRFALSEASGSEGGDGLSEGGSGEGGNGRGVTAVCLSRWRWQLRFGWQLHRWTTVWAQMMVRTLLAAVDNLRRRGGVAAPAGDANGGSDVVGVQPLFQRSVTLADTSFLQRQGVDAVSAS